MVTKTAKTGVVKVMVDHSPMHVPENYTQSHQNTSSHSNTNVYLGRLIDEELLDTIRGFGNY